jgi:hypothetical protein
MPSYDYLSIFLKEPIMPEKSKLTPEEVRQIPKAELLEIINKMKGHIRDHEVVSDMFDEYGVDLDELDLIPMAFADLDVSARTDHGVIYLNYRLLEDGDWRDDDHYLVHEITHFLQQTTGTKPTQGANDGDYLENKFEQEGFQNQTEYISDTKGDKEAEEYVEQVLDHHDVQDPKERQQKRKDLLNLALSNPTVKAAARIKKKFKVEQNSDQLKVVTAYHGGPMPIRHFSPHYSAMGGIFWFSEDKDAILAGEKGISAKYLMTARLTMKKTAGWTEYERYGIGELRNMGYDSVKLDDDWIVFDKRQIEVVNVENINEQTTGTKPTQALSELGQVKIAKSLSLDTSIEVSKDDLRNAADTLRKYLLQYDKLELDAAAERYKFTLEKISKRWSGITYRFKIDPLATMKAENALSEDYGNKPIYKYKRPQDALEAIPKNPGFGYRGMSFGEWKNILKSGFVSSKGVYNLGDSQIGLTFFSKDPDSAAHYASGFAPWQFKATHNKPAVIIAVDKNNLKGEGGLAGIPPGSNELASDANIPLKEIKEVYYLVPTEVISGFIELTRRGNDVSQGNGLLHMTKVALIRIK